MSQLIKCNSCSQEVSPEAKSCPKCGAPVKKKAGFLKIVLYAFIGLWVFIFSLAFIGGCAKGCSNSLNKRQAEKPSNEETAQTTTAANPIPQPQPQAAPKSIKQMAKIGDEIVFNDSKWTVLSAEDLGASIRGLLDQTKSTEGKFVKVKFTVVNTTKEEDSILGTPKLVASDGAKYEQLNAAGLFLPQGEKEMMLEQLPSRIKKNFSAIYEVPKDASALRFEARSLSGFNTKYVEVDLGL